MAKKITAITTLVIIGILIVTTIILAIVPVNHSIKCAKPDAIDVYYGTTSQRMPNPIKDSEQFNKIVDTITNSTNETALTALFDGTINKNAEIVTQSANTLLTVPVNSTAFYISYIYTNPQVLKDGNKDYKDENGNKYFYKQLCFEILNEQTEDYINVYIIPESFTPSSTGSLQYQKYYKLSANLEELHTYLSSLGYKN